MLTLIPESCYIAQAPSKNAVAGRPRLESYWSHGDNHACLAIRRMVSGLPFRLRKLRRFAVLQFCIDDSGTDQPPVFVLAGYLARVNNWPYFSDDWDKALRKAPAIDYLKASEAFHRTDPKSQFYGWTLDATINKLKTFLPIIRKYRLE